MHKKVLGAMVLAVVLMPCAFCATADKPNVGRGDPLDHQKADAGTATLIIREIDDPNNGACWLLLSDPHHPGGPGRLVLAGAVRNKLGPTKADVYKGEPPLPPVIQTGDRLILEEHSTVVDGRLDAIALNPADIGGPVQVRLVVGGQVVHASAVAPGSVILAQEKDGRE